MQVIGLSGEEVLLRILAMPPAMPSGLIALFVVATPLPRCKRFFPFLQKIAGFPIRDRNSADVIVFGCGMWVQNKFRSNLIVNLVSL